MKDVANGRDTRALPYLPGLDALRFLFAIMVVAHHTVFVDGKFLGPSAVTGFFVLSGFLITTLLVREDEETGKLALADFYWRRVLRIWPVYFIALALAFAAIRIGWPAPLAGFFDHEREFLWRDLTFTRNLLGPRLINGPFGHLWSISVEEQFYLAWPLAFVLLRRHVFRVAALALVVAALAWQRSDVWSRFIPVALGCLCAFVPKPVIPAWLGSAQIRCAALVLFAGSVVQGVYSYGVAESAICLLLVISFARAPVGPAWDRAGGVALARLGRQSYSLYVFHVLCIALARRWLKGAGTGGRLAVFALTTVLAIGLSAALWSFVESPILRLRSRPASGGAWSFAARLAAFSSIALVSAGVVSALMEVVP